MSWVMPEEWADDFDPILADWQQASPSHILQFPREIAARGWSNGTLKQRDWWVRFPDKGPWETLVIEWAKPWREVIAIIRDGVVITDMPESKEEFDSFWKIPMGS